MNDMTGEFIKNEMIGAANTSEKIVRLVMEDCSVGRGLLAGALAYVLLAKSAPVNVSLEELHDIVDSVYRLVSDAEGEGHVIQ